MPSRKQRRRAQKERRHEYETVWVDAEGNELEQPPEDAVAAASARRDGAKPKSQQQQRGGRAGRVPQPPSWERAARRSLILGAVIFALFLVLGSRKSGGSNIPSALGLAGLYTLLFIPFTYFLDRFAYNRYQRRVEQHGQKGQARKR